MKRVAMMLGLSGVLLFGLGVGTGLAAKTYADSKNRVEKDRTDLSGAPGMEVIASLAEYKPGDSLDLHSHPGIEASYVVQGASLGFAGEAPIKLTTGSTLLALRDIKHGDFKIVGDTSLKLYTVHIVDKGKPLYEFGN